MTVNLDPAAIRVELCTYSEKGDFKNVRRLLESPEVQIEIDKGPGDSLPWPSWPPLSRAFNALHKEGSYECCIELLRRGANANAPAIVRNSVIQAFTTDSQSSPYGQEIDKHKVIWYHTMVANRLLDNDIASLTTLLSSKCRLSYLFDATTLLEEVAFHTSKPGAKVDLSITYQQIARSTEEIDDIIKEKFAEFCKRKSGCTTLLAEKPEQADLGVTLQLICSQLLMTPYKPDLLRALELEENLGIEFINKITDQFTKNFDHVFKSLFLNDPGQTETILLANYSPLFAEFLQIYHYYAQAEWKPELESILINVTATCAKEPLAVSLSSEIAHLRTENGMLSSRVQKLETMVCELIKKIDSRDTKKDPT